jgi:hypothetical protein
MTNISEGAFMSSRGTTRNIDTQTIHIGDEEERVLKIYKQLSSFNLLYKNIKISTFFFLFSIVTYTVGMVGVFYNIKDNTKAAYFGIGILIFMVASVVLNQRSKAYIRKHYTYIDRISVSMNIERIKRLKIKLRGLGYTKSEQIDDLIENIDINNEKSKFERMLPLSILVLILIPIWNEYVGFRYNALLRDVDGNIIYSKVFEIGLHISLIGIFVVWIPSVIIVIIVRTIFLVNINKRENLCKMLRQLSHHYKKAEG